MSIALLAGARAITNVPFFAVAGEDTLSDEWAEDAKSQGTKFEIIELRCQDRLHVFRVGSNVVPSSQDVLVPGGPLTKFVVEDEIVILLVLCFNRSHVAKHDVNSERQPARPHKGWFAT
jgi:hypothetical protein